MGTHRVMIVEDHAPTRQVLRRTFARAGWEVIEAATIADALAGLDPSPGCVVLDLKLPDGAGEIVLRKIRVDNLLIPVVAVLTGVSDAIRLGELAKLRPEALFLKPIEPEVMVRLCASEIGDTGIWQGTPGWRAEVDDPGAGSPHGGARMPTTSRRGTGR